jgi:integrase
MLKRVNRWAYIKDAYSKIERPREQKEAGKALTPQQENAFRNLARQRWNEPDLTVACCTSLISMGTTAGPGELKSLKLENVHLDAEVPYFEIPLTGAKRYTRARPCSLNGDSLQAMRILVERAEACGSVQPDHYLLPRQLPGSRNWKGAPKYNFDPTRHQQNWRVGLRVLLAELGFDLRIYEFRHHAVTRLLENRNIPLATAQAAAGWISPNMIRRYYHLRMEAAQQVASALNPTVPPVQQPVQTVKKQPRGTGKRLVKKAN